MMQDFHEHENTEIANNSDTAEEIVEDMEISIEDMLGDVLEDTIVPKIDEDSEGDSHERLMDEEQLQIDKKSFNESTVHLETVTKESDLLAAALSTPEEEHDALYESLRAEFIAAHPEEADRFPKTLEHAAKLVYKERIIQEIEGEIAEHVDFEQRRETDEEGGPVAIEYIDVEDLKAIPDGLRMFYVEYAEVLKATTVVEKEKRMEVLERKFTERLTALHPEKSYSRDTIRRTIRLLTEDEETLSMRSILLDKVIERKRLSALYGLDPTGRAVEKMEEILSSALSEGKKTETIDSFFRKLFAISLKVEDPGLREFLVAEFKSIDLLKTAKKILIGEADERKAEKELDEKAGITAEKIQNVAAALTVGTGLVLFFGGETHEGIPEEDHELFMELARTGYPEFALKIIKQDNPPLERMDDGSYKATVEGEDVFLANQNGKIHVYLQQGERQIPIEATQPEDTGFDLARSEKIALKHGWADVVQRRFLRYSLLDHPADKEFMGNDEATRFESLLTILLRDSQDPHLRLVQLGILDENEDTDPRFVNAYKRTLDSWTTDHDLESLAANVTAGDITLLSEALKQQLEDGGNIESGAIHSLESLRADAETNEE